VETDVSELRTAPIFRVAVYRIGLLFNDPVSLDSIQGVSERMVKKVKDEPVHTSISKMCQSTWSANEV
jgi:hypothetical protein